MRSINVILKKYKLGYILFSLMFMAFMMPTPARSAPKKKTKKYPVAIMTFSERGSGMKGKGANVSDLLFAGMVENPFLYLVERAELSKIIKEQELNLSGLVSQETAIKVGRLVGAKILITGSVFKVGKKIYIVAKIISTETGKVLGKSANGTDEIDVLALKLAKSLGKVIKDSAADLFGPVVTKKERITTLKTATKGKKLPTAMISIVEKHIGKSVIDPAAETEMIFIYKAIGGVTLDAKEGKKEDAEIFIKGEGFSEFARKTGKLISVKARLEVKVLDKNGKIIAIDRETVWAVDLTETIAGKTALQEAAAIIASRLLIKLAK
ncbi:MAG: curli assembly protein CsgG [Planctomycetota bacterium]|nr:MAG: curli assembly protein CsgG [Planctomycetota bacterium]